MAMEFTSVKCPECGANLPIEEGRERVFCSYCGTQIVMTNENEHTYRHIDEAELKRAETEQLIHLKELEMVEKENERSRNSQRTAYTVAGIMALVGLLYGILSPDGFYGAFAVEIAAMIAMLTFASARRQEKKARRIIPSSEARITGDMRNCKGKNYNAVAAMFRHAGFNNIKTVPLDDLNFFTSNKNGQVESISINGNDDFDEGEIFQRSESVLITYHSMR